MENNRGEEGGRYFPLHRNWRKMKNEEGGIRLGIFKPCTGN
jgi:hypothetical protein